MSARHVFTLSLPIHKVAAERSAGMLTLGSLEVEHISVLLEHVDLLDAVDWLNVELLEGSLQLLVTIGTSGPLGLADNLSAGRALSACIASQSAGKQRGRQEEPWGEKIFLPT